MKNPTTKSSQLKKQNAIKLSIVVSKIHNDVKTVISTPEITVYDGKTATLSQQTPDNKDFELSVTPQTIF